MIDTSRRVRAAYREPKAAQRGQITALFRDMRIDVIEVSTDKDDYVPELTRFSRHRERKSR